MNSRLEWLYLCSVKECQLWFLSVSKHVAEMANTKLTIQMHTIVHLTRNTQVPTCSDHIMEINYSKIARMEHTRGQYDDKT